jgi:hypothetical protein
VRIFLPNSFGHTWERERCGEVERLRVPQWRPEAQVREPEEGQAREPEEA